MLRLVLPFQLVVAAAAVTVSTLLLVSDQFVETVDAASSAGKGTLKGFLHADIEFLATDLGCLIISSLLGLQSLRNTVLTYLLLWASAGVGIFISHWGVRVSIFSLSVGLWVGGLQLSKHPGVLASLFEL
jgi:general stress protein CsbA